MLERETEMLLAAYRERTIGERDAIRLDALPGADIPAAVKRYIEAEIRAGFARDLTAGIHTALIDTEDPAARKLLSAFTRSLAVYRVCRRSEFLTLLDQAVHFVENYLCRPRWTLERYLFDAGDSLPVDRLFAKLQTLADYQYLPLVIERVLRRRGAREVSREELRQLVRQADAEVVRSHAPRELALLTRPIFEFFSPAATPPGPGGAITLSPLLVFFEDKELKVLKEYVSSICHIRGKDRITLDGLITLVEDLYTGNPPSGLPLPAPEAHGTSEGQEPEASPPEPPAAHEPPPEPETTAPSMPEPQTTAPPPASVPSGRRNIALSLTYAGLQESGRPAAPNEPLPDLAHVLSDEQRARLIPALFHNDPEYFDSVVRALNDTESWKEASLLLNDFLQVNGLDPLAHDVIEFTDAVHARFQSGGNR